MQDSNVCSVCNVSGKEAHATQECMDCKGGACTCEMGCCQDESAPKDEMAGSVE